GIPNEIQDVNSADRYRQFKLQPASTSGTGRTGGTGSTGPSVDQVETYYLTYARRLGANKYFSASKPTPDVRFAVWAPNAQKVEVVFGDSASGYIYDDGRGVDTTRAPISLHKSSDGVWQSDPQADLAAVEGL